MQVQVICPGLFGPHSASPPDQPPPTPALDRLLTRADRRLAPDRDPLQTLAAAFALASGAPQGLPSAPLCLLAQAPDLARSGCWFHADPVHLRPDRDRLLGFGGPRLGVTAEEAAALANTFNHHFRDDGLELLVTAPGDWYLRVPTAPDLTTSPLYRASGRALDPYLPAGPDARGWGRWQNEAQMLFFQHSVNRAREAAGRPLISGVWTWGGGVLPEVRKTAATPDLIRARHPLAAGLAHATGVSLGEPGTLAESTHRWPDPSPRQVLIFWDALWWPAIDGDQAAWCQALTGLEPMLARLLGDLAAGKVRTLTLDDGETARFHLDRWGLHRFWRRRGGLGARLAGPAPSA